MSKKAESLAASRLLPIAFLLASTAPYAFTQSAADNTGNDLLSGSYNFRQVVYVVGDLAGTFSRRLSLSGTILFDGAGNYSLNGTLADTDTASSAYSFSGTYAIGAAGHGWVSSPLSAGVRIRGSVADGVFVGSSTEGGYNDLFLAALAPAGEPTNAALSGTYRLAYFDAPATDSGQVRSAWLSMEANGAGGTTGDILVDGYFGSSPSTIVEQSVSGAQYTVASAGGQITFPEGPLVAQLISGTKTFYMAHGGDLLFGGSTDGFDLLIGIRVGQSRGPFTGLYVEGGLYEQISAESARFDSYYGAFVPVSAESTPGLILGHQRINSVFVSQPYDFTYRDDYEAGDAAEYEDALAQYAISADGFARLGLGKGPLLGIRLAVRAPELSGDGVFINPAGVLNGASYAPYTSGASPGAILTLFGENLAPSTAVAQSLPFPASLEGVQVLVNGQPAPLYLVAPQQISLVLPLDLEGPAASVQVMNGGQASNQVTITLRQSSPGVFTIPAVGFGLAAALHLDYSLLSEQNPAQPGETIAVYLTGLGQVSNPPSPGSPAPSNPFSIALEQVSVIIGGEPAVTSFAGLAPTLAGLYQINVEIPANTSAGEISLDIAGPDSYTAQTYLPVGGASSARGTSAQLPDSAQHRLARFLARQTPEKPAAAEFYFD